MVKSSEILFWDDLSHLDTVQIVERELPVPDEEFLDQSNIRNTRLKVYRKYLSNFQGIKKKIKKEEVELAVEKIKKKLWKLDNLLSKKNQRKNIRSGNQILDLKEFYPILTESILLSKNSFDKLHRSFFTRMKFVLRLRKSALTFISKDQNSELNRDFLQNKVQIRRDVDFLNRNPHSLQKHFAEQAHRIDLIQMIDHFLKESEIQSKSLKILHNEFRITHPSESLCLTSFSRLVKMLNLKYLKSKRFTRNDEEEKVRRINFLIDLIDHHNNRKEELLFFDVTSLSEKAFKSKSWQYKTRPTGFKPKFQFQATHILMLISTKKVISVQFVKGNLSSLIIFTFVFESILRLKDDLGPKQIRIILDNATMHHTVMMKNLFLLERVKAVFPPPHNPYFNMIEYVFRFIKGGLKKELTLK